MDEAPFEQLLSDVNPFLATVTPPSWVLLGFVALAFLYAWWVKRKAQAQFVQVDLQNKAVIRAHNQLYDRVTRLERAPAARQAGAALPPPAPAPAVPTRRTQRRNAKPKAGEPGGRTSLERLLADEDDE